MAAFQFQASPRSQAATAELLGNLNRVTASGTMPTFESAGARSGYVHKRQLRRAEKIGAAFLSLEAAGLRRTRPVCGHGGGGGGGGGEGACEQPTPPDD